MPPQIAATPYSRSRNVSITFRPVFASTSCSTPSRSVTRSKGMNSLRQIAWVKQLVCRWRVVAGKRQAPMPQIGQETVDPRVILQIEDADRPRQPATPQQCGPLPQQLRVVGQQAGHIRQRISHGGIFPVDQAWLPRADQVLVTQVAMDDACRTT